MILFILRGKAIGTEQNRACPGLGKGGGGGKPWKGMRKFGGDGTDPECDYDDDF